MSAPVRQRTDPNVLLVPVAGVCFVAAVIAAASARDLSPTFVLFGMAGILCGGVGLGAVAGELNRRHPVGFGQALHIFAWLCTGWFVLSMIRHHYRD